MVQEALAIVVDHINLNFYLASEMRTLSQSVLNTETQR
jgi:hypothetical protein